MKKLAYKNEDLIQQVQNYLNKILSETNSKQKRLRESINSTLDTLKKDLESLQPSQNKNEQLTQEPNEIKNDENANNDSVSEQPSNDIENQDETIVDNNKNEIIENNESDNIKDKQEEIVENNNISEATDIKNNIVLIGAEKYWEPFKLACNSKNPVKIREIALDALQYLISHRMLTGSTPLDTYQEPINTPNLTSGIIKDIKGPDGDESTVSVVSESEPTTPVDKSNNNNNNNNNNATSTATFNDIWLNPSVFTVAPEEKNKDKNHDISMNSTIAVTELSKLSEKSSSGINDSSIPSYLTSNTDNILQNSLNETIYNQYINIDENTNNLREKLKNNIKDELQKNGVTITDETNKLDEGMTSISNKILESVVDEGLQELKSFLRNDIKNMHLEIISQFHYQKYKVEKMFKEQQEKIGPLLKELQKLREENERLKCNLYKS